MKHLYRLFYFAIIMSLSFTSTAQIFVDSSIGNDGSGTGSLTNPYRTISYAVQKLDAQRVSLALLSQSVVTGLIAWLFINEKISLQMIIGGIVILAGIGITFIKKKNLS